MHCRDCAQMRECTSTYARRRSRAQARIRTCALVHTCNMALSGRTRLSTDAKVEIRGCLVNVSASRPIFDAVHRWPNEVVARFSQMPSDQRRARGGRTASSCEALRRDLAISRYRDGALSRRSRAATSRCRTPARSRACAFAQVHLRVRALARDHTHARTRKCATAAARSCICALARLCTGARGGVGGRRLRGVFGLASERADHRRSSTWNTMFRVALVHSCTIARTGARLRRRICASAREGDLALSQPRDRACARLCECAQVRAGFGGQRLRGVSGIASEGDDHRRSSA
jgi:hypothetical protein